jgi:hypothetical protein
MQSFADTRHGQPVPLVGDLFWLAVTPQKKFQETNPISVREGVEAQTWSAGGSALFVGTAYSAGLQMRKRRMSVRE